ncbi:GapA-binding peptide SR1P [Shouchella clausii]|jgi:hypothetical protein|uniref:GapA-binding peptide SR1P n=1 Tax=Shouchella clausii TaxID=79880 RepID=A0A268RYK6_SHOCL|nr:GapA-binding peptide SR1P [Shouchella clausii]PAD44811.1 hypothetical protein CHH54_00185 [Bacillus sp. 7520-S]AST97369.1 hypothetical protein BC8716_15965 [Shouchella clausii]PAD09174.1 hypothetical protein CHH76_10700 [Shouchella clausii]PAD17993.1 hypothetical protein CHH74_00110 [Shouchella clausii]PAD93623.1 hypothetical protein CHH52_03540 [Shouchella clausii]
MQVGTIVCQHCNEAVEHFEGEKVSRLYAVSSCSRCQQQTTETLAKK